MKENGDKIDAALKSDLESQIHKVRELTNGTDFAAMKSETDRLQTIMQNASAQLYQRASQQQDHQAQGPQGDPENSGGEPGNSGEAVEADYEVVK